MHRITDQRLVGTKESAGFELPNGVCGVMMGDNQEEVLKRIDVLRAFYIWCELTNERQVVKMPNGQSVAGVPVGLTGQDILAVAEAALAIHDGQSDFSPCQRLQSPATH